MAASHPARGLGIRDPIQTQPAARMAALVGLELNGRERVGVPEVALSRPSQDLVATIDALRAQLGPNFEPLAGWYANPTQLASASFDHASQRWWAEQVAQEQRSRLCQLGTARDMARLPGGSHFQRLDVSAALPGCPDGHW